MKGVKLHNAGARAAVGASYQDLLNAGFKPDWPASIHPTVERLRAGGDKGHYAEIGPAYGRRFLCLSAWGYLCLRSGDPCRCFHMANQRISEDHYVKFHPEYGKVWLAAKCNGTLHTLMVSISSGPAGELITEPAPSPQQRRKRKVRAHHHLGPAATLSTQGLCLPGHRQSAGQAQPEWICVRRLRLPSSLRSLLGLGTGSLTCCVTSVMRRPQGRFCLHQR